MKKMILAMTLSCALLVSITSFANTQQPNTNNQTAEQKMLKMSQKMVSRRSCYLAKKLMWMGVNVNQFGKVMKSMNEQKGDQADKLVALGKQMFSVGYELKSNLKCRWTSKKMMHKYRKMMMQKLKMLHQKTNDMANDQKPSN